MFEFWRGRCLPVLLNGLVFSLSCRIDTLMKKPSFPVVKVSFSKNSVFWLIQVFNNLSWKTCIFDKLGLSFINWVYRENRSFSTLVQPKNLDYQKTWFFTFEKPSFSINKVSLLVEKPSVLMKKLCLSAINWVYQINFLFGLPKLSYQKLKTLLFNSSGLAYDFGWGRSGKVIWQIPPHINWMYTRVARGMCDIITIYNFPFSKLLLDI